MAQVAAVSSLRMTEKNGKDIDDTPPVYRIKHQKLGCFKNSRHRDVRDQQSHERNRKLEGIEGDASFRVRIGKT